MFVDDMDTGDKPRLLLYVEDSIQDGVERDDGSRRVVSKEFRFIELDAERNMRNAGYAPYLDYRAPRPSEREQVQKIVAEQKWLGADIEAEARSFAANNIVPDHFRKVLYATVGTDQQDREGRAREAWRWDRILGFEGVGAQ